MYDELIKNLRKMQSHEYCVLVSIDGFPAMQIVKQAADAIEKLQKRKHGKWIYQFHEDEVEVTCSECGMYEESFAKWIYDDGYRIDYNYCPECGADMRGYSNV